MKLSDYMIKFLENYGIKNIYGVSGGLSMHLLDSIGHSEKLKFIPFKHEQSACISAEGEAIFKNDLAVCLTTGGPGILNTVNPVASAYTDSNPMLIIAGSCKVADSMIGTGLRQKGVQEVPAIDILKPITKYSISVTNENEIRYHLEKAIYLATHERKGPVFLEIPLDIQNKEIDEDNLKEFNFHTDFVWEYVYGSDDLDKTIDLLNNAKRPVILAGNGIRLSESLNEFKRLVSALRIPVLLTWKTIDFYDSTSFFNFGCPGSIAPRYSNFILQNSDLVLCIGARMDLPTIAYDINNFAPNAKKVIVDCDENELNKYDNKNIIKIKMYANNFIDEIIDKYVENEIKDINRDAWLFKKCYEWRQNYPICLPEYYNETDYVNPYVFLEELSKLLIGEEIIIPSSSGSATEIPCQSFKIKGNQRFICSNMLGSMGYAISHAIGVSFANDHKRKIICIEGDGSIQMNLSELQLINQYNIPVKIFLWNNQGYNSIKNTQDNFFSGYYVGSTSDSGVINPFFDKIANAYDIKYYKIQNHENMDFYLKNSLNFDGPCIIEVMTNPSQKTLPRVQNTVDENGKIVSGKLENLFPFLSKDELESNMIKD